MNKLARFACYLAITGSLAACSPKQPPASDPAEPAKSAAPVDLSAPSEAASRDAAPSSDDKSADNREKSDSDIWKQFPRPALADSQTPQFNEDKTCQIFTLGDANFQDGYRVQIKDAGFEASENGVFVKETPDSPLLIMMEQGEGEFVLTLCRTRDPRGLYAKIPDRRIPYPLDGAVAADFGDCQLPGEASNETVYRYYNRNRDFALSYEKQLSAAGFQNVRIPESPLYTKMTADHTELSVALEKINDSGTDMRIKMMAVHPDNP